LRGVQPAAGPPAELPLVEGTDSGRRSSDEPLERLNALAQSIIQGTNPSGNDKTQGEKNIPAVSWIESAPLPRSRLPTPPAASQRAAVQSASRSIHIRIGTVEVQAPPPEPPLPPGPAAPTNQGFEDYAALRTYAGWEGADI